MMKKLISYIWVVLLIAMCNVTYAENVKTESDGFKWCPYTEYGRVGAKSASGEIIVPAKYRSCQYEMGKFTVKDNVGYTGVVGLDGKIIIPIQYPVVNVIKGCGKNSPYVVVGNHGYGVYSNEGNLLIIPQYRSIQPYVTSKGIYYVVINGRGFAGIVNSVGKWIVAPTKYNNFIVENIRGNVYFSYFLYGKNRSTGVLDSVGNKLISTHYMSTRPFLNAKGELCFNVQQNYTSKGILDSKGKIIQAPIIADSYMLQKFGTQDIYVVINKQGLWGIADKDKRIRIPCKYEGIQLNYPFFTVREGAFLGMYNESFKYIIPTSHAYTSVSKVTTKSPNDNFIAAIATNNLQALYDLNGKKLSDATHQHIMFHVFNYKDTVLVYSDNGKWGCEDLQHKTIFPLRYQDLNYMETSIGNYYIVFQDNFVGLCDSEGTEIISPQYTQIEFVGAKGMNYFLAKNGGYVAAFATDGTQLINGETFSAIWYDAGKSQFVASQGKRKCYFAKDGSFVSDNSLDIEQDKYITLADEFFERGKYKDAARNYGRAIDIKPTASLYFNRAVSYYNMDKYYDAIADFRLCLDNNPSQNLRSRSLDLIDKAEAYQQQKEQRKSQIAGAIFGLVLSGANAYFQAQTQKQRAKYNTNYSSSTSSGSTYSSSDGEGFSTSSTSTGDSNQCPSLRVNRGKWYCANTGRCGMCGGDGFMDDNLGGGANRHKCTLCGGSGKCKYCQK